VQGTLQCDGTLLVAEDATIDAAVDAAGIIVAGTLTGDIACRGRLEIRPTGVVRANVRTASLVIHEGAVYEGELRMEVGAAPREALPVAEPGGEPEPLDEDADDSTYPFMRRFSSTSPTDDDLPSATDPQSDEDDER
jgi:cytoskeletal protein CcmA (bactofilin family)